MNKKLIWTIAAVMAVIVPILLVLILNGTVLKEKPVEFVSVELENGGKITPSDETAANALQNDDGTTQDDAIFDYVSAQGYKLQYNAKYKTDFSGEMSDFFISNNNNTVNVSVTVINSDEAVTKIQTKEEWDNFMGNVFDFESIAFGRRNINGMDTLVANYNVANEQGNVKDVLIAMFLDGDKIYNYMYSADFSANETEKQQIGAILYTITKN